MARKPAWRVEISDTVEPFEQEWRSLRRADNSTPFQDYDLMRVFYRQLAENRLMQPVIALVRDPDGTPVAVFPLMKTRRFGLTWLRMDARPLDHCVPLLDTSLQEKQIYSIIREVMKAIPGVDLLYCNRMPERFEGRDNPLAKFKNAGRLRLSSWQLPLSDTSLKEIVGRRQKRFRSKLSSRIKQLSASHERRFAIALGADISPQDLIEFKDLRSQSFAEKQRSDILGDPAWTGFYDGMIENTGGDCRAFLATLKADGQMIAGLYGFVSDGRVEVVLPASLMGEWKDFLPGLQLFDETIAYFFNKNFRIYDLSIGDMAYKRRFGADRVSIYDALFPFSAAGFAYYVMWRIKIGIRSRMKSISSE